MPKLFKKPTTTPCKICNKMIATMGEISSIPIGGIIPLKIPKKGSTSERMPANGWLSQSIDGIQLKNILKIIKI